MGKLSDLMNDIENREIIRQLEESEQKRIKQNKIRQLIKIVSDAYGGGDIQAELDEDLQFIMQHYNIDDLIVEKHSTLLL